MQWLRDHILPPAYPPLPPDMPLPPLLEHEPHYHETASRAMNAHARVRMAERVMLQAELDAIEREGRP